MKKNIHNNNKFLGRISAVICCLIILNVFAQAQTVTKAEYFFDIDQGFGKNTQVNLTHAADSTWQLPSVSTAGLSAGYHRLYIRTKDSNSQWSNTACFTIEIVATQSVERDSIIAAEYFLDNDPKFGSGKKIKVSSPDSSISRKYTIPKSVFTNAAIGYHTLYIRVKDQLGRWSETTANRIELIKSEDSTSVVRVEYFFNSNDDSGFGSCSSKSIIIASPFVNDSATFYIPYNQVPFAANDTLFLRVREKTTNRWSQTAYKGGLNITTAGPRLAQVIESGSFSIYPNPASDHIDIEFNNSITDSMRFTMTNLMGEAVLEKALSEQKSLLNLNYPNGIYFITLSNSKQSITQKLVVQNH